MRAPWFLCLLSLWACERPTSTSHVYVGAPAAERIGEQIVAPELMRSIRATYLMEETRGDGNLGPSDRTLFMRVDIEPGSVVQWRAHLKPHSSGTKPRFVRPTQETKWWPQESPLPHAQVVARPSILKGSIHGWAVVSERGDRVYLYSYTQ